ncbi:hypothetical protein Ancab_038884 [Ancistrocladus abbreviatus]
MSEKVLLSSRVLFSLTVISMFILFCSSIFLLRSDDNPVTPTSFFTFIVVNKKPVSPKLENNVNAMFDPSLLSIVPSIDSFKPNDSQEGPLLIPSSNDNVDAPSATMMDTEICGPKQALLRVYMYDLPTEFHFGLLGWKGRPNEMWPDVSNTGQIPPYPGGLNLQHSVEYWLTLDLLSSNIGDIVRPCSVVRVRNSSMADVIFVPFFASLSYNRHSKTQGKEEVSVNRMLQNRLVKFLMDQHEWRRSKGKDHVIVAHHPNSMLYVRKKLGYAMFVLADFGRYPVKVANLGKDVIAPYKHVVRSLNPDSSLPFEQRTILAYFKGAIYRKDGGAIRQELFYLLKDKKDVHFTFGNSLRSGVREASQGMASSKFCLNIAGDTPSSNRLFDSIVSHCVPVIISDEIELPFEDFLDYSEFTIFVRASDAVKQGFLLNLLRGIGKDEWTKMWERLKEIAHHFEYQYPSQPEDAVDMIWQAIARKMSNVHKNHQRKYRSPQGL